jgi:hypothetical protein
MKNKYFNFYWIFIFLLQVYLITEKYINIGYILSRKFYLWNIVVMICSVVFLHNRVKLNKILVNYEKIIILIFVINAISTVFIQIISKEEILKIVITILIISASIFIGNSIEKEQKI